MNMAWFRWPFQWLTSRVGSGERDVSPGGGEDEVTDEGAVLVSHWEQHRYTHSHTSRSDTVTEESYSFTVREKCLTGPPASWGRRRSSLITDYIGRRLGGSFSSEPEDMVDCPCSPENTPVCNLSTSTQDILKRIFADLVSQPIMTYHLVLA